MDTRVEEVMGTVAGIRVIGRPADPDRVERARTACFAELHDLERVFTTYRDDSDISRIRLGDLRPDDADARVAEVAALCDHWSTRTGGRFSARWQGWFDPTGLVKGWATERAARRRLAPLCELAGVDAVGLTVGGDIQVFRAPGQHRLWRVGIADPRRPGSLMATLEIAEGAVATSGMGERGAHIVDPRTGEPVTGVLSATVVADSLTAADVWATAACVAGPDDLSWVTGAGTTSGLVLAADGRVRRWSGAAEVVDVADVRLPAPGAGRSTPPVMSAPG